MHNIKKYLATLCFSFALISNTISLYATEVLDMNQTESVPYYEDTSDLSKQEFTEYINSLNLKEQKLTNHNISLINEENINSSIVNVSENLSATKSSSYPSSYDGRVYCTPVKTQNRDTCWSYSVISTIESVLLKSGLADANTLDLSEMYLIYATYNKTIDPLNNISNDYYQLYENGEVIDFEDESYIEAMLANGGNPMFASMKISNGLLLKTEEEVPFFKTDGSLNLPSEARIGESFADVLHSQYCLFSPDNTELIKKMIYENGGVATCYLSDTDYYKIAGEDTSYYYPTSTNSVNHAIEVVGWDDNYSKNNFKTVPESDGAWLCKNSWGTYSDGITYGSSGYFWMSYCDKSFVNGSSYANSFVIGDEMSYEDIYQYDGCNLSSTISTSKCSNIFEIKRDNVTQINGAAIGLGDIGSNYKINIYINPKYNITKAYDSNGTAYDKYTLTSYDTCYKNIYSGSNLISGIKYDSFFEPIYVQKGDKVAVEYVFNNNVRNKVMISYTEDIGWMKAFETKETNQISLLEDIVYPDYTPAVRLLTTETDYVFSTGMQRLSDEIINVNTYITVEGDETTTVTESEQVFAKVLPSNAKQGITWSSSNPSIATVDTNGIIKSVGNGSCVITGTSEDGRSTITFTVNSKIIKTVKTTGISIKNKNTTLYVGNNVDLEAEITPSDATDKNIVWYSSDTDVVEIRGNKAVAVAVGDSIVTAQSGNYSDSFVITVKEKPAMGNNDVEDDEIEIDIPNDDEITDNDEDESSDVTNGIIRNAAFAKYKNCYEITSKDTVTYTGYIGTLKSVTIPNTIDFNNTRYKVTHIADNALKNNRSVQHVRIGKYVKTIGKNAFSGCVNLKTVSIGENVTTIEERAFKNCKLLYEVVFPNKVKTIKKEAFLGCKKINKITFGKNLTTIGDKAFKKCTSLTKITIPSKVTKIGKEAFSKCENIKKIVIKSKKIKSIGKNAIKNIDDKAIIDVPSKKIKAYKKLFKSKVGFKKTMKIK